MTVRLPDLAAAAPFYGRQAKAEDVAKIEAPLPLHCAGLDRRINQGWPTYEAAPKAHGKEDTAHIYPGVNHGCHNDTTPRYDAAAAELAWTRAVAFSNAKPAWASGTGRNGPRRRVAGPVASVNTARQSARRLPFPSAGLGYLRNV